VSPDTALRLARFFGTTPHAWLNLQASDDLTIAMQETGTRIERDIAPLTASRDVDLVVLRANHTGTRPDFT
jgi:plasmid maintenance system antidote protein VapI